MRNTLLPTIVRRKAVTIRDLPSIADEVTRLTREMTGNEFNVSSNPIYLTVYTSDIPYDLTLIDDENACRPVRLS